MRHFGHQRSTPRRRLYCAALVSMFGSVCVWKGTWNLLEMYVFPPGAASEVACVLGGVACLWGSRALVNAASVVDAGSLMIDM